MSWTIGLSVLCVTVAVANRIPYRNEYWKAYNKLPSPGKISKRGIDDFTNFESSYPTVVKKRTDFGVFGGPGGFERGYGWNGGFGGDFGGHGGYGVHHGGFHYGPFDHHVPIHHPPMHHGFHEHHDYSHHHVAPPPQQHFVPLPIPIPYPINSGGGGCGPICISNNHHDNHHCCHGHCCHHHCCHPCCCCCRK